MKIIKPDNQVFLHGLFETRIYTFNLGLIALFDLSNPEFNSLKAETDLWDIWGQFSGTFSTLDAGFPKPKAEFEAYGVAHAPSERSTSPLAVTVQVGEIAKTLLIHGPRHWTTLGNASSPQPLTQIPVTPENAYGGLGYALNPLGKGYRQDELPQIEDPNHPIAFRSDEREPAGFWGFPSHSPQRQKWLGKTDANWLREHWPALPPDTAPEFFQAAPPDQWGPPAWRGDEAIELENWHPEQPLIRSRLPGLRARCFAQRVTPQGEKVFEEIPTHAETVYLFPTLGYGAVLYRGSIAINDPDARDITHIVADWENMSDAPQPMESYRECLETGQPLSESLKEAQAQAQEKTQAAEAASADAAQTSPSSFAADAAPSSAVPLSAAAAAAAGIGVAAAAFAGSETKASTQQASAPKPSGLDTSTAQTSEPVSTPQAEPASIQAASPYQHILDKVLVGQPLTDADAKILASAAPHEMPELTDAHMKAMTQQMLDQRDAMLAEHGLTEADVAAFLKQQGASHEAITLGGMSRAELEAIGSGTASTVAPSTASLDLPPGPSPHQHILDKVLVGQPLTDADAKILASAAPHEMPELTDAHMQAMTQQMLDQRDAMLAEHGLTEADVAAFLRQQGASHEAITLGGMSRAQLEAIGSGSAAAISDSASAALAEAAALPQVSPHQHIVDKVLLGQPLTEADAKVLASAAPHELPEFTDAHMQAMTQQMLDQRDAMLAEHGLTEADVAAFLKQQGASHEAITLGGMSRAELEAIGAPALPPVVSEQVPEEAPKEARSFSNQRAASEPQPSPQPAQPASKLEAASAAVEKPRPEKDWKSLNAIGTGIALGASAANAAAATSPEPASAPTGALTREEVLARHQAGQSLAELDLSGLDLSNADLNAARFEGCILEKTCFDGSLLQGAVFTRAMLQEASFEKADLTQAQLDNVRAHKARFNGACAIRASLVGADMSASEWRSASLLQAQAERADFSNSQMEQLKASEIQAPHANFHECQLRQADFSQAQLTRASFDRALLEAARFDQAQASGSEWYGTRAPQASFTQADMSQARGGMQADFSQSDFRAVRLDGASWQNIGLRQAVLHGASLINTDLSGLEGQGLQMQGAHAQGAQFEHANLQAADLRASNLMGASVRNAKLAGAQLDLCNLHGCDMLDSDIGKASTEGALLTSTLMVIEGRAETRRN